MAEGVAIGAIVSALGEAYGAYSSSQTSGSNLGAQQQHAAMIQQYVNQYLQSPQSDYSNAALQFITGTHAPQTNGSVGTAGSYNGTTGMGGGYGGSSGSGTGVNTTPNSSIPPGSGVIGGVNYGPPNAPIDYSKPASIAPPAAGSLPGTPAAQMDWWTTLGYTKVGDAYYNGAGQRLNDQQMAATAQQIASGAPGSFPQGYYGPNGYTAYTPDQINAIRSSAAGQNNAPNSTTGTSQGTTNTGTSQQGNPTTDPIQQIISQLAASGNPQITKALQQLGVTIPNSTAGTNVASPSALPTGATSAQPLLSSIGEPSATEVPTQGPVTGEPGGGIQDGGGGGTGGPSYQGHPINMPAAYQYQSQGAFTYNPNTLNPPQQAQVGQSSNIPQVTAGTQGQNAGQDALMQMLRRNYQIQQNPELDNSLRQQLGGAQFDNTGLFSALKAQNAQSLDQQVNALQGSAGSLGQRFGTALSNNEALLRSTATTNEAAQLAQLQSQSFENAQNRQIQAIGLGTAALQNTNQNILTNQAQQLQAATSAGQLGAQQQGYDLQASQSNASNALQQGLNTQQQQTQTSQFNSSQALQQALQNAGILNAAGQFNAAAGQTAASQNTQQGNIYNQLMLQGLGQAQGAQAQQTGQNTSLIGLLAGLSVPQANTQNPYASAAGNIGQLAQLYPFLQQLGQSNSPTPTSQSPIQYY